MSLTRFPRISVFCFADAIADAYAYAIADAYAYAIADAYADYRTYFPARAKESTMKMRKTPTKE
jgi:hypothetical protein